MSHEERRQAIIRYLEEHLSPARYRHSLEVGRLARELARRFGVQEEGAELAGLWHDAAKEVPMAEQQAWARKAGLDADIIRYAPQVLHGPLAAERWKELFGELPGDEAILEAVATHTTGAAGMGKVALTVFVADFLEEGHGTGASPEAQEAAQAKTLEEAGFFVAKAKLAHLAAHGRWIAPDLLFCYNYLWSRARGEE
ncbi:MAG: bis(5'-nucleosyl)-tetraphosphatase (symmetrical) YqeK [Clostridiales bacterium]|nr:bis(5'-nucleosyl)-tetraphosphatase (symmetrical) YqeK [Clostridiales bacterium]